MNCGTCQFSKKYGDDKVSKNGVMVYCGYYKKATHFNATCEEYTRDNVLANEQTKAAAKTPAGKCARCGFTWFAHQLAGMAASTCEEFQPAALAQQDELFALDSIVKKRGASMEAEA